MTKEKESVLVLEPGEKTNSTYNVANIQDITTFGKTLQRFVAENKLSCVLEGKNYVYVDGWKFAGVNFGLTALVDSPQLISKEGDKLCIIYGMRNRKDKRTNQWKEMEVAVCVTDIPEQIEEEKKLKGFTKIKWIHHYKYKCECKVINMQTGAIVSTGTAICTNYELNKISFDEYAISSMCQTRAISKAYRNLIGYIMTAAGFESTPAEEMEGTDNTNTKAEYDGKELKVSENDKLPEEIENEILSIADTVTLAKWTKDNSHLHKNLQFQALVKKRKQEILDAVALLKKVK
jgi:hypothetical protein